jgi:hypothetical protein
MLVCIWFKMQWPHPRSCDMSEIRTSTHVRKIANRNYGSSFLKNIFIVPIQKLGKLLRTKESVKHIMYLYNVWWEGGTQTRHLHFFSCHSSLLRWQEYEAIYVKVRAHCPLSWNYVVKISAFEDTLRPVNGHLVLDGSAVCIQNIIFLLRAFCGRRNKALFVDCCMES